MPTLDVVINPAGAESGARRAQAAIGGIQTAARGVTTSLAGVTAGADRAGVAAGRTGTLFRDAFAGLAGLAVLRQTVSALSSFEDASARLRIAVDATSQSASEQARQFAALSAAARDVGAGTSFGVGQATEALALLTRTGFGAADAVRVLPDVLNVATIANVKLAESADLVSDVLSAFQLPATASAKVADLLALASARADVGLVALGRGLQTIAPDAQRVGISIEEVAATLAVLGDAGIDGERGARAVQAVLRALIDPSKDGAQVLSDLSASVGEQAGRITGGLLPALKQLRDGEISASEAFALFSARTGGAQGILSQSADAVGVLTAALRESEGAAQKQADTLNKTLGVQLATASQAVRDLAVGLDGALGPAAGAAAKAITDATTGLASGQIATTALTGATQGLVLALGAGGLLGSLRLVVSFLGPGGLLLTGLSAAALAVVGLFRQFGLASDQVRKLSTAVDGLAASLRDVSTAAEVGGGKSLEDQASAALRVIEAREALSQRLRIEAAQTPSGAPPARVPVAVLGEGGQGLPPIAAVRSAVADEIARQRSLAAAPGGGQFGAAQTAAQGRIDELESIQRAGITTLGDVKRIVERFPGLSVSLLAAADALDESSALGRRNVEDIRANVVGPPPAVPVLPQQAGRIGPPTAPSPLELQGPADDALARAQARAVEFDVSRQALQSLSDLADQRQQEAQLAALSAGAIERERAVIEARNALLGSSISLTQQQVDAIRDEVRQRQQAAFARSVNARLGDLRQETRLAGLTPNIAEQEREAIEARNAAAELGITLSQETERALRGEVAARQAEIQALRTGFDIATAITDPLKAGLLSGDFTDVGRSIVERIQSALLAAAFAPLENALAGLFKGVLSGVAGGLQTGASTNPPIGPPVASAQGNVFAAGNLVPFARGGIPDVVDQPTTFGLRGGKTGLAGEAGPEAIVPLRRTASGDLGVQTTGNAAASQRAAPTFVTSTTNIYASDQSSLRRAMRQAAEDKRRALALPHERR